ncbi:MAG: hypothetical protein OEY64_05290 [Nitrospinota bacterium]|nr:hypothetical protein [Nitrospinota bacterium]
MTKNSYDKTPPAVARIQGTDGVRAQVAIATGFEEGPLEVFQKYGVMTEEFFELYCYSHVTALIERGELEKGGEVLIGWDSRDVEGFYTSKALSGIAKGGAKPCVLGTIPTPGVSLALFARGTSTAFMITASHNPSDQNGIKIFLSPHGGKTLPADDEILTAKLFKTDYEKVRLAKILFESEDISSWARSLFIDFHADPRNSWGGKQDLFADTVVVLDTAHGATAGVVKDIFNRCGINDIIHVASEQNGNINENSGVAMLEGIKSISYADYEAGSSISSHQGVNAIFAEIACRREAYARGEKKLFGVVFDGDGDRFFLLYYQSDSDSVHVLSGDECAALQGEYLIKRDPEKYRGTLFVHSVESDINLARHADALGFVPRLTAVGDKWVLQEAILSGDKFGIGCEETGHSIHGGYAVDASGSERLFYAGNGIKGAINTLCAIMELSKSERGFSEKFLEPFEPGYKKTSYSYYVNKKSFHRGSRIWNGVKEIVEKFFSAASGEFVIREEPMDSEPDMLYFLIRDKGDKIMGSVFVRNSGTEDKIGVNLRGDAPLSKMLGDVADEAVFYLMREMKNMENPLAKAESEILKKISERESINEDEFTHIGFKRLITEMEIKQKLIRRYGSGYELTGLGRRLIG